MKGIKKPHDFGERISKKWKEKTQIYDNKTKDI